MPHHRLLPLLPALLALGLGACAWLNPPEEVGRLCDLAPARYGQYEYDPSLLGSPDIDPVANIMRPFRPARPAKPDAGDGGDTVATNDSSDSTAAATPEPADPSPATPTLAFGAPGDRLVHFAVASDLLQDGDLDTLEQHARYLHAHPELHVRIEGHSDARGSDAYNLALAARRAAAVRTYLLHQGVRPGQISVVSFGKSKPLARDGSEDGWGRNRRVELVYR